MNEYLSQHRCQSRDSYFREQPRGDETGGVQWSGNSNSTNAAKADDKAGSSTVSAGDAELNDCIVGSVVGWSDKDDFTICPSTSCRPKTAHTIVSASNVQDEGFGEFYADTKNADCRPFSALPLSRTKYRMGGSSGNSSSISAAASGSGSGHSFAGGGGSSRAVDIDSQKAQIKRRSTHRIRFRRVPSASRLRQQGSGAEDEGEGEDDGEEHRMRQQRQLQEHQLLLQKQRQPQHLLLRHHRGKERGASVSNPSSTAQQSLESKVGFEAGTSKEHKSASSLGRRRASSADAGKSSSPSSSTTSSSTATRRLLLSGKQTATASAASTTTTTTTTTTFMNSLSQAYPLTSHRHIYKQPVQASTRRGNLRDILRLQPVLKAVNAAGSGSTNMHDIDSSGSTHRQESDLHAQQPHHHHLHQHDMHPQLHSAGVSRSSVKKEEEISTRSVLTLRMSARPFSSSPTPTSPSRALPLPSIASSSSPWSER